MVAALTGAARMSTPGSGDATASTSKHLVTDNSTKEQILYLPLKIPLNI